MVDVRESFGQDLLPEFEDNYRQKLLSTFENELRVTEGLENVLDALSCKSCVATSSSPKRVKRSLELAGLIANDYSTMEHRGAGEHHRAG